jgi:hypothetical protein
MVSPEGPRLEGNFSPCPGDGADLFFKQALFGPAVRYKSTGARHFC